MSMKRRLLVLGGNPAACGFVLGAADGSYPADRVPVRSVSREPALAAFETVNAVLQHPRCQNCHIPDNAPLQMD